MTDHERARRPKKKVCMFCVDKVEHIDYKDTAKLRRYVTEKEARSCQDVSAVTVQSTKDSYNSYQACKNYSTIAIRC